MGLCCTKNLYEDDPNVWYASAVAMKLDYDVGRALGEGMFARVYRVTRRRDGALFAAKVFKWVRRLKRAGPKQDQQDRTMRHRTEPGQIGPNQEQQDRTRANRINRTEPGPTGPNQDKQDRARPNRTEPG